MWGVGKGQCSSQANRCNVVDLMFFSNKGKPQRNAKSKSLQSNYALVEWNIGNGQTLAASQCQISDGIGIYVEQKGPN